jgi:hypothetical protein
MSGLRFNKVTICSEAEQAAVAMAFHPRRTLLWGPNGAGKSAILKSVYRAFDAEPHGRLPGWDYNAIIAVDFQVDGRELTTVRKGDLRAMFAGERLIAACTSSVQWNAVFAREVGFELQLLDRAGAFRHAAPANFFLPFFINQDGSFGTAWDTFDSIKQFQSAPLHTLEYFARVQAPRYFELKASEQGVKAQEAQLRVELATLQRTRVRVKKNLQTVPIKLSQREFQREVTDLSAQLRHLSKEQDALRKAMVEDEELLRGLDTQIALSAAALKEHSADFKYASDAGVEQARFVCPTCHAEHENSFHMFLGLAEDARELNELKKRLEEYAVTARGRLERNRRKAAALKEKFASLQTLLATKRGKFTFDDFIKSRSAFAADLQLASEEEVVSKQLEKHLSHLRDIKVELKSLKQSHDSRTPLEEFREHFRTTLVELQLSGLDDASEATLDDWPLAKRPSNSGSRYARSIVAYYAALWRTVAGRGGVPCPLVIDSPNQGAQDRKRLQALLTTIAANAPAGSQVILAHEEDAREVFKPDLVHAMSENTRVLSKEAFDELSPRMLFYVEQSLAALAKTRYAGAEAVRSEDGEDE